MRNTEYLDRDEEVTRIQHQKAERSLGGLLADLSRDVLRLVRQEIEFAKTEMSNKASRAYTDVSLLVVGGAIAFGGFLSLLLAAVIGLAAIMHPALAALVVGVVVLAVGLILVQRGRSRLKQTELIPRRTLEALKEDKEWMERQAS